MLGTLEAKLIGGGIAALVLLAAFMWFKGVLHERSELRDWQHTVLVSTQKASSNPKLIARDVAAQIDNMGKALVGYRETVAVQNEKVAELGTKSKNALAEAAHQAVLRKEVIQQSESLADQLRNEALTPVEREKLEAQLRHAQDLAWEAGL
jgi:hypothetical protein